MLSINLNYFGFCCLLILLSMLPDATAQQKPALKNKASANQMTNSIGMKLTLVPAGKFQMGSPSSEPRRNDNEQLHKVEISQPFYIGVFEVTQGEYQKVMGANPSNYSTSGNRADRVANMDTNRFPVEWVSHSEAMEFCVRLNCLPAERAAGRVYRLPYEAEWERACRGGRRDAIFSFGNRLSSDQANIDGRNPYGDVEKSVYLARPTEVGSYEPNDYGIYDMHGNVCEWCFDRYEADYYKNSPAIDPQGPTSAAIDARVIRGGAWNYMA